jgi:hypothetical protein
MNIWKHFKKQMKDERGFVISSAVVGSTFITGLVAAGTITAGTAAVVGVGTAALVYGGLAWGLSGLLKGGGSGGQQQQQGPDFNAQQQQAQSKEVAQETLKRKRVAVSKNKTDLSDKSDEPKLGTTGLLGNY